MCSSDLLYLPIKVSAQASQKADEFFRNIYHNLKDELNKRWQVVSPDDDFLEKKSSPFWRPVTELLRKNEQTLLTAKRRILFLIDEWQQLAIWDEDSSGKGNVDTIRFQVPEFVKVLRDQYDKVAVVLLFGLSTLRDIETANFQWISQLGGRLEEQQVTNLNFDEADELITRQLNRENIKISQECLTRIRSYTAAHALLQMLMGYYIFEILTEDGRFRIGRTVMPADVDRAAEQIPSADLKFIWADPWIRNKPAVRLFLGALGKLSYQHAAERGNLASVTSYSIREVRDYLHRYGDVAYTDNDFRTVIADLDAQGVIARNNDSTEERYYLRYPLFAIVCDREQLLPQFLDQWRQFVAHRN